MKSWGIAVLLASMGVVSPALGQTLPAEPLAFADGRLTIGGDVSGTYGSDDSHGFFNYTDYEHSALRMLRIDVSGALNPNGRVALLAELRTENFDTLQPYAFYVRVRPWRTHAFDINVGRVPPTFGAFARRTYPADNPLIGYPLGYQYLTTLRPDAVPGSADELLQKRGSGWLVRYQYGSQALDRGVPLVSAFRWDTGVQIHAGNDMVSGAVSITTGTVSNPLFSDDNSGRQFAGRLEIKPVAGLILGASAAHGPFVSDTAARGTVGEGHDGEFTQTAWGADAEYSWSYYLVRFEAIHSAWRMPVVHTPALTDPLGALSTSLEGRYKIMPGFYVAGRVDHLSFSDIVGTAATLPWDAPVTRVEAGIGYSIQRNLLLKIAVQHDTRDGGRLVPRGTFGAGQLVYWF
jgi:hypothetical protein